MSNKSNIINDSNKEPIKFIGTISKKIFSKKTEKFIGVNIQNITVTDNFYQDEYKNLISKMQKEFFKMYKRKCERSSLLLFAPKVLNYQLDYTDRYDINSEVIFNVSIKKDNENNKEIFNACNLKIHYSKEKENTSKINSMSYGIHFNRKYTPIEKLSLNNKDLKGILDKLYDNSSFEEIIEFQGIINSWISKRIEKSKKIEYEKECKRLEQLKKTEIHESTISLAKAAENMKTLYKQYLVSS